jgi:DNA-binding MarR family transcriptional regulator
MVLRLHQVGLLLDEVMQDRLRDLDLTTLQGHTLVLVSLRPAGVTVSELRTNLGVSSSRMSTILRCLQRQGLIERSVDGLDRRFVVVVLTAFGRHTARLVREAADDLEERLIESSPSDDILLGYAVADLIGRSRWIGPGRLRIRMPDWS